MRRNHPDPDTLIDQLPHPMRKAYRAAELRLNDAKFVMTIIKWNMDRELPKAIARLAMWTHEQEAAVRACTNDLTRARRGIPFAAMGSTYPTAQLAALDYCGKIEEAISSALKKYNIFLITIPGKNNEGLGVEVAKELLLKNGVLSSDLWRGPSWKTFREAFHQKPLPGVEPVDLLTAMWREVAGLAMTLAMKHNNDAGVEGANRGEEWLPASEAVNLAERAGLSVSISWLSKSAKKGVIKARHRQEPGKRRYLEVEWNFLIGRLVKKKAEDAHDGDAKEPSPGEQQQIDEEIQQADAQKRRQRPTG